MAMLLAGAAILDQAALLLSDDRYRDAGARLRSSTLSSAAAGVRTFDLGGSASTSDVVDDVIIRLKALTVS
jgi:isocitrate/isopropylmalate dehydrogenase